MNSDDRKKMPRRIYRSEKDRVIAGVAGGLGDYFQIDPLIIRLIFILVSIVGGWGLIIYLLLWVAFPSESSLSSAFDSNTIGSNVAGLGRDGKKITQDLTAETKPSILRSYIGAIIVIFGILKLFENLGYHAFEFLFDLWPVLLIALGLSLLANSKE